MTEVDTVMHEGGSAPVPASTSQITAAAAESSDNDNDNERVTTAAASSNGDAAKETKSTTTESSRNAMKIAESRATSTTSSSSTSTSSTTTTISTKSSSTSPSNDNNKKKIPRETEKAASADKSDQTPMEVDDDDDDDDDSGAAAVTTTTAEQECEEDSQVTSSSTDVEGNEATAAATATGAENEKKQQKAAESVTAAKSQNSADAATSSSPAAVEIEAEAAAGSDAEAEAAAVEVPSTAENSNSQTVDGNDLSVEHDKNEVEVEAEAEAEAKVEAKAKIPTKEKNAASATTNNLDEKSPSCDSINENQSKRSHQDSKEPKKLNSSDVEDDKEEEDSALSSEKKPSQSKKEANNAAEVLSESKIIPASPSPATKDESAKQNCIKEPSNVPHVDLIEKMEVDDDEETDPLGIDMDSTSIVNSSEAKNGLDDEVSVSAGTKDLTNNNNNSSNNNNGSIVDLDDSDDDDASSNHDDGKQQSEQSNGSNLRDSNSISNKKSVCSDSDGAVVICSDSESEVNTSPKVVNRPTVKPQKLPPPKPLQPETDDDDDDDCVVIEDDSPSELTPKPNDQGRRKSTAFDSENNSDDSQPPSKRQRRIGGIGASQLTIKDARSLLPTETTLPPAGGGGNGKKFLNQNDGGGTIYPVNITPAGGTITIAPNSGPPKLAPIGGGNTLSTTTTGGGVIHGGGGIGTGLNNANSNANTNANANLLPGLTDDMFVLEAPSFIVPYIYEKPPSDSLKDIVKEIEAKYELTKDDLTEADKSDEFDMMTEQNKEDRDPQAAASSSSTAAATKKKKKRRFAPDVDDSWSEESDDDDDDDDDDDSESGVRTKVLIKEATDDLTALKGAIKPAAAVAQSIASAANTTNTPTKPGQENYFESPLGKFFMDIGVGLVQEFVQTDLIRLQKRKMRKSLGKNMMDFERAIAALSGNLEASKKKNSAFKFTMKRCEFCNFKSESALAMAHHYETPHMNGPLYKCNFCTFEIRNATEIVYHMEAMHNIKARLIKPLPYHQCPNCGFEDNGKAKLARHQPVCAKKFRPELNLAPPNDWEAPAKIPRIKPRHGLVGTATAYQAMAAQAAAQKAALATIQQQQQQQQQARNLQAAALAAQNAVNKIRGRPPVLSKVGGNIGPNGTATVIRGATSQTGPRTMATNVVLPNNYQLPGNQIIPATNAMHTGKKAPTLPGQPSISITPLPRQSTTTTSQANTAAAAGLSSTPSTSKTTLAGIKPGRNPTGGKAQFVICEICDGYIKDLEQLRNHMQWMHEVKIHPKMIYNRPPLNCQKCQFRFFTDQGLERHLLGSHGLVTSSMQEAANKGKDAGRCPVCGRMYQWKLLNHVARDHHMTLKPAHLSYKCTVCTATFGMYKQFETHVYTAHSTVAKKAMDSKKNNSSASSVNASGGSGGAGASASSSSGAASQRSGGGGMSTAASNDALLKPLKINDEITIIPQPASKPRITNMESHVID